MFTCRFRCRCQCRYAHTKISKLPFSWILSVSDGKEVALDIKNLYDFPYSLMHIRTSDEISNHKKKPYLALACSKATIKTLEKHMKYV